MIIKEIIMRAGQALKQAGIETAMLDARLLVCAACGYRLEDLIAYPEKEITETELSLIETYIQRRESGEPVSKILGFKEFWGIPFIVTKDTLDPRPDTETLVAATLKGTDKGKAYRILDLGTGTGCILLSLLLELPKSTGVGVDISVHALGIAQMNAKQLKLDHRVDFIMSNWFEQVDGLFDIIVSNPPYIPNLEIENLSKEVKNHDPTLALDGGKDGLDPYYILIREIKSYLKPGGRALFEVGLSQAESVVRLVDDSALQIVGTTPDIAGIPRVVEILHGEK